MKLQSCNNRTLKSPLKIQSRTRKIKIINCNVNKQQKNISFVPKGHSNEAFSRHSISWQKCAVKPSPNICLFIFVVGINKDYAKFSLTA
jgi:hypothetical protein